MDLFNYLTGYSRQTDYRKLLVAPVNMRQRFVELISNEIAITLSGKPGRIIAKMNTLEDPVIVRKLYEASQAGVSIDLIVRGNCRLRPGLPGLVKTSGHQHHRPLLRTFPYFIRQWG